MEKSPYGFLRFPYIIVKTALGNTYEISFGGIESLKNRDVAFRIMQYLFQRSHGQLPPALPADIEKAIGGLKWPEAQADMREIFKEEINNPSELLISCAPFFFSFLSSVLLNCTH